MFEKLKSFFKSKDSPGDAPNIGATVEGKRIVSKKDNTTIVAQIGTLVCNHADILSLEQELSREDFKSFNRAYKDFLGATRTYGVPMKESRKTLQRNKISKFLNLLLMHGEKIRIKRVLKSNKQ
ncbi:MAG: hypothetical protein CMO74_14130 [Verrucomicrobiales bacterium]|nr:hypothetical protein [Verrucomicrobiales bacterium]|tara:strand:+ start:39672 stop:40043 length:372 start_codon:yes stop_codon:yes gene_type:complete